jgi:secreted trypsin-like serine protease
MKSKPARIAAAWSAVCGVALLGIVSMAQAPGAAADQPSAQTSVIGGREAAPGSYPWMAFVVDLLEAEKGPIEGAIGCSGTVLSPRVILTAAHCTMDEQSKTLNSTSGYLVVTGVVNWTDPQRRLSKVARMIPYPKWAPGSARDGFGDAALLILETPTTAPPVSLATPSDTRYLRLGTHARVTGWGMTYYEQPGFTESLMWAKTTLESSRCEGLWGRICAIDFPKAASGICHGDSGGPLFVSDRKRGWLEIGITEAVFDRCTTHRPQLFTRTDLLSKWIKSRVQQIEAQP